MSNFCGIFPLNASLRSLLPLKGKADGLAELLVSLLASLQLGLRGLAVLYFSEGQTFLLAKKRLPVGDTQEPFREIPWKNLSQFQYRFQFPEIELDQFRKSG